MIDRLVLVVIIAFSFVVGWVACTLFDEYVNVVNPAHGQFDGLDPEDGYCVLENLTALDREFCLQNE